MAEDAEWVLESVLGFLSCPVWKMPVADFIEQQCSVFDDEEENKLSYTEIHNEYKEMSMLQSVVAVEEFAVFKEMMLQKNIELQLQAIQIIQQRNGVLPECLKNGTDVISDLEQQEMKLISEALRISREEYEQEQLRKKEIGAANLGENSSKTSTDYKITAAVTAKPLEAKKQPLEVQERPYKPTTVTFKELSNTEAAEAWMEQAWKEAGIQGSVTSLTKTEQEQLRERAEYLKQKRAVLLERKLDSKKKTQSSEECKEEASCSTQQTMTDEEIKNLQKRKQLAEKLKEEVIHK
ncbi:cilia- and flagella-associated protein 36 isoform X2 [Mixophyes fleayi]|uniref:cilia- and flagella-associated protein 36 isoform X2 n=1 Tax=Mixophyes fleayi TaxID=3061075 RepID=UPI003F4DC218